MSATDKEGRLIALAMGHTGLTFSSGSDGYLCRERGGFFNPANSIADCTDMEAALMICVKWKPVFNEVECIGAINGDARLICVTKELESFPSKQAARMAASCEVARQIGLRIREGK